MEIIILQNLNKTTSNLSQHSLSLKVFPVRILKVFHPSTFGNTTISSNSLGMSSVIAVFIIVTSVSKMLLVLMMKLTFKAS